MNEFISPELVNIDDVAEGVYAGSGAWGTNPDTNPPIIETKECWVNWQCKWTGHNNGHHSVCHISANHCGDHSGECLTINFVTNFPIKEVKNASGYTITNVGTYSFSIIRNNHFNPGESIGFNFEIVTSATMYDESGKQLEGAIGAHNADAYYCKVASYECG